MEDDRVTAIIGSDANASGVRGECTTAQREPLRLRRAPLDALRHNAVRVDGRRTCRVALFGNEMLRTANGEPIVGFAGATFEFAPTQRIYGVDLGSSLRGTRTRGGD